MKNALFTVFLMMTATQAQASLLCLSDGSFGGIKETRIILPQSAGASTQVETLIVRSDLSTYKVQNQNQDGGALETDGIVLYQDFEMGHGNTRYSLQKSGTQYQLVKSFQCDSANGEEFCNTWDRSFHVQNVFAGVSCSEY